MAGRSWPTARGRDCKANKVSRGREEHGLHRIASELSHHNSGRNTHPWSVTTISSEQGAQNVMTVAQYMAAKNGHLAELKTLLRGVNDPQIKLLHVAAAEGHEDVVIYLVEQFPELLNERDDLYQTALHLAARKDRVAVVRYLIGCPGIDRDCKDGYHRTPLHIASITGNAGMVMELCKRRYVTVETKDMAGRTPLHYAALKGHVAAVKLLTDRRDAAADPNAQDNLGCTPLHLAAYDKEALGALKLLLFLPRIYWDPRNTDGLTPLHLAAQVGNAEAVSHLQPLYTDANSSASNVWLQTPLQVAAAAGHVQVIQVIRNCLARDDMRFAEIADYSDTIGRTAFHYAAMYGHTAVMEVLLTWGDHLQSVLERKDDSGLTALHLAAREGHDGVVRRLIAASVDVNVKADRSSIAPDLRSWALSKLVIQTNFKSSDFQQSQGMSALHFAARGGHMPVVKELFKSKQLETSGVDRNGLTPLDWARISGSLDQYLVHAADKCLESLHVLSSSRWKYLQDMLTVEKQEAFTYQSHVHKNKVETRFSVPTDENVESVIHEAASRGDEDLIRQLLCLPEIDANEQDIAGNTPAHLAARYGHAGALKVLLNHPAVVPNMKNHWKDTPFRLAFKGNHVEACKMILKKFEVEENLGMLLRDAIRKDWFEMSAMLVLQKSTGPMDQGRDGKSALELARDQGNRYVELVLRRKDVRRRLLEDRIGFTETADAILVASTLIASITYQGWLEPPQSHNGSALRCFWWLNSLSFYFAVAGVLAGAMGALPTPRTELMDSVFKARRAVTVGCMFLATATVSVMGAFGAAGLAVIWDYQVAILVPLVLGSVLCISVLLWFARRLFRLHWVSTLWEIVSRDNQEPPTTTAQLLAFTPVCSGAGLLDTAKPYDAIKLSTLCKIRS